MSIRFYGFPGSGCSSFLLTGFVQCSARHGTRLQKLGGGLDNCNNMLKFSVEYLIF
jgi:hypothetical protein